jgi:hypothetical protein
MTDRTFHRIWAAIKRHFDASKRTAREEVLAHMVEGRNSKHIKLLIWVILIILGGILVNRIPAQTVKAAPLKCGPYQHEVKIPEGCLHTCTSESPICTTECIHIPAEDVCVDNTHMMTERGWQTVISLGQNALNNTPQGGFIVADAKGAYLDCDLAGNHVVKCEFLNGMTLEAAMQIIFDGTMRERRTEDKPAQTVKPALPPQHHTAPQTAPPVRPATACRVVTSTGPVTGWGPCSKAHRTAQRLTAHGLWAGVESKIGKEK